MVLVLVAVVVVAALAVVVFLRLRPRGGDLDSVRSYHSALGTLEHLGDRSGQSSLRVTGPAGRVTEAPTKPRIDPAGVVSTSLPPIPAGDDGLPDPEAPLVFDDARPADGPRPQPLHVATVPARVDRAQRHALESMNHRPHRSTAVLAAVAVLALFGVLAYSGSRRTTSTHHPGSSPSSTTAASDAHPIRPIVSASAGSHRAKTSGKQKTTRPAAPASIVAASSSSGAATYPVTAGPYQLSLTALGPCWVLARSTATGTTLWTGTLKAGENQVIPATGRVTLELGALGVAVKVNRTPVVFPQAMETPFVATFQPVPGGSSTGASGSTGFSTSTSSSTATFSSVPNTAPGAPSG